MPEQPRSAAATARLAFTSPPAFLALGLGIGLVPIAPGTAGSALGLLLALPLRNLPAFEQILIVAAAFLIGIWACDRTGRALNCPDAAAIVIDEVVAMAAVALLVPQSPIWWAASFVAFRLFDILKPWPIRVADRQLKNGFGVMLDDALAAVYAWAAVALANAITRALGG